MTQLKSFTIGLLVLSAVLLGSISYAYAYSPIGSGSVSGTVFLDSKCNGLDLSDKPLKGAKAELSSKLLKGKLSMKSDAQGNFRFIGLRYGLYSLNVDPSGSYKPKSDSRLVTISEVSGTVSETFVFCPKK